MTESASPGAQLILLCPQNHLAGNLFRSADGIDFERAEGAGPRPWDEFLDEHGNFIVECGGCNGLEVYEEAVKLLDVLNDESNVAIRVTYDLCSWPE